MIIWNKEPLIGYEIFLWEQRLYANIADVYWIHREREREVEEKVGSSNEKYYMWRGPRKQHVFEFEGTQVVSTCPACRGKAYDKN
jgi:hypothetical protein